MAKALESLQNEEEIKPVSEAPEEQAEQNETEDEAKGHQKRMVAQETSEQVQSSKEIALTDMPEEHTNQDQEIKELLFLKKAAARYGTEGRELLLFVEKEDMIRDEKGQLLGIDFTGAKEKVKAFSFRDKEKIEGTGFQNGTEKEDEDLFLLGARRGARV